MKIKQFTCISMLLASLAPSFSGEPSLTAKKYLAENNVFVLSDSMAVIERMAYGKADVKEALPLLKSQGIEVHNELDQGVGFIKRSDAIGRDALDITTQVGAHMSPILIGKDPRFKIIPLQRVVFSFTGDSVIDDIKRQFHYSSYQLMNGTYAIDLTGEMNEWASIELAAELSEMPDVSWAVPDCMRNVQKHYLPNDSAGQWHLYNTNAPPRTNSSAMAGGWSTTLGSPDVVIAIMDDGVDIMHPDISPNVYTNQMEIPGDGIDNDSNGYIDDVTGWSFYGNTNVVYPTDPDENHGTSTAGLAASRGDNGLGVLGSCPRCRILPIKLYGGNNFVTDSQWAMAVEYASRYAQVISVSLGQSSVLAAQIISAYNNASTSSIIFASTSNDGDVGWYETECPATASSGAFYGWLFHSDTVAAGAHTYRWAYEKDSSVSEPYDSAWIDAITFPDGSFQDFESGSWPAGWTTGGNASWFLSPESNDSLVVGAYSMRSGSIGHSQTSWLQRTVSGAGTVSFFYQVLGEMSCNGADEVTVWDGLYFTIDGAYSLWDANQDIESDWGFNPWAVQYPAALTSVVAVGASTIGGYKSTYSSFGSNVEVVATSSGSTVEDRVLTTDRVGASGYDGSDYTDTFGGTSASCPIAAGIAGLVLSANPYLTVQELRQIIRDSARKIGYVPYTSGFNERYGYGQITAAAAMGLMLSNMPPELVRIEQNFGDIRLHMKGVETNRLYYIHAATSRTGTSWNWVNLFPGGLMGSPVFGTNATHFLSPLGYEVFKIEK